MNLKTEENRSPSRRSLKSRKEIVKILKSKSIYSLEKVDRKLDHLFETRKCF